METVQQADHNHRGDWPNQWVSVPVFEKADRPSLPPSLPPSHNHGSGRPPLQKKT